MSKFKVGDRVRANGAGNSPDGGMGTVKAVREDRGDMPYSVEFDEPFYGHDCDGDTKDRHGWHCRGDWLTLVEATTTLAVGAKVKVVDEFDSYSGHIGTVEDKDNSGWLEWHVRFDDGELQYYDARHLQVITGTAAPASAPAANPLADLLAGFSATPSTGGGITFNLTINLPPGAITELLAAVR